MPMISVGIPVYNGERYIKDSIESILSQTYSDFELIISDNASTDKTISICKEYANQDKRIKLHLNNNNIGASGNFRKVFELSSGKYFKWQCHDDTCSRNMLQEALEKLENDCSRVLAFPLTVIKWEDGREVLSQDCWRALLAQENVSKRISFRVRNAKGPTTPIFGLIRSEVLRKTRLIDSFTHSDQVLILELAMQGRFALLERSTHYFRQHRKKSLNATKDPRERLLWFDPSYKGNPPDEMLHLYQEMFKSVSKGDVALTHKIMCYPAILNAYLRRVFFKVTGVRFSNFKKLQLVDRGTSS